MNLLKSYAIIICLTVSAVITAQITGRTTDNQPTTLSDAFKNPETENITFSFVQISDILYTAENESCNNTLQRMIREINGNTSIAFVIITGNISKDGDCQSLTAVKKILDKLNKPYYVIPGECDTRKSESAGIDFKRVFGDNKFRILFNGFVFIGISSAPDNGTDYGHIALQDMAWAERQFKNVGKRTPIFVISQYPMTQQYVDNALKLTDIARKYNTQAFIGSYCNESGFEDYDGIRGIMSKAQSDNGMTGGYTLYNVKEDSLVIFDKALGMQPEQRAAIPIEQKFYVEEISKQYYRAEFAVNNEYKNIRIGWKKELEYGIYTSAAANNKKVYFGDEKGTLHILTADKGKEVGKFNTFGKIVSSPIIADEKIIFGSCDKSLYCIDPESGKQIWRTPLGNAITGNPALYNNTLYIGVSKNFYAIETESGSILWKFVQTTGNPILKPVLDEGKIAFCTDDNKIYVLDATNGSLLSETDINSENSPMAALLSSIKGNKISIDNTENLYLLNITKDNNICFYRSDNDSIIAKSTNGENTILWQAYIKEAKYIVPHTLAESGDRIIFGTKNGLVICMDKAEGKTIWKYKTGTSAINTPTAISDKEWIITTTNGIAYCIKEK